MQETRCGENTTRKKPTCKEGRSKAKSIKEIRPQVERNKVARTERQAVKKIRLQPWEIPGPRQYIRKDIGETGLQVRKASGWGDGKQACKKLGYACEGKRIRSKE